MTLPSDHTALLARIRELESDSDEAHALITRQSDLLTSIANALLGAPAPLHQHSHADLAERATALREELAHVTDERDAALTASRATVERIADRLDLDEITEDRILEAINTALARVDVADQQWDDGIEEGLTQGEAARDELLAILTGRTTPPTLREIQAHSRKHRGLWLVEGSSVTMAWLDVDFADDVDHLSIAYSNDALAMRGEHALEWLASITGKVIIPIGDDSRPCAWPVAAD